VRRWTPVPTLLYTSSTPIEQQDLKLEERAAMIIVLEQQLQAPPKPIVDAEPGVVSDVDEG
jgi:hypothetical protein